MKKLRKLIVTCMLMAVVAAASLPPSAHALSPACEKFRTSVAGTNSAFWAALKCLATDFQGFVEITGDL